MDPAKRVCLPFLPTHSITDKGFQTCDYTGNIPARGMGEFVYIFTMVALLTL